MAPRLPERSAAPPRRKPCGDLIRRDFQTPAPHPKSVATQAQPGAGGVGAASDGASLMTPQERDLITQLLGRLKQTGGQAKDPEAEQLIRQAIAEQPDAPYFLVQTVLIQDMALSQAQQRIAELERQLAAAK